MTNPTELDPTQDGIDHINVYSQGKTELGRLLSNFTHLPFKHPVHGHFASMEGYWYWCGSGRSHEHLRRLYGMSAKSAGLKCPGVPLPEEEFEAMIVEGLRCKVEQNPGLKDMVQESTLPFKHYFVYGKGPSAIVVHKEKHNWQMEALTEIRRDLQGIVVEPEENFLTVEWMKCHFFDVAGITHHGPIPTREELDTYARVLHWTPEEIGTFATAPNTWALKRKIPTVEPTNIDPDLAWTLGHF